MSRATELLPILLTSIAWVGLIIMFMIYIVHRKKKRKALKVKRKELINKTKYIVDRDSDHK